MSLFQFHPESATIQYVDKPSTPTCPHAHTICRIVSEDDEVDIFLPYLGRLEVV